MKNSLEQAAKGKYFKPDGLQRRYSSKKLQSGLKLSSPPNERDLTQDQLFEKKNANIPLLELNLDERHR